MSVRVILFFSCLLCDPFSFFFRKYQRKGRPTQSSGRRQEAENVLKNSPLHDNWIVIRALKLSRQIPGGHWTRPPLTSRRLYWPDDWRRPSNRDRRLANCYHYRLRPCGCWRRKVYQHGDQKRLIGAPCSTSGMSDKPPSGTGNCEQRKFEIAQFSATLGLFIPGYDKQRDSSRLHARIWQACQQKFQCHCGWVQELKHAGIAQLNQ